jgi:pantoate--beta-alanine ligase
VEIVGAPIVREADGLAMSSRNKYLKGDDRKAALCLSRGLFRARERFAAGERDVAALVDGARREIEAEPRAKFEYAEARDPETLLPLAGLSDRAAILVAARVGPARLIDNITLEGGDS